MWVSLSLELEVRVMAGFHCVVHNLVTFEESHPNWTKAGVNYLHQNNSAPLEQEDELPVYLQPFALGFYDVNQQGES